MRKNWDEVPVDEIKDPSAYSIAMGPFGSNIKTDNFVSSGVPVIRGVNLNHNRFLDDEFVYLTDEKADELKSANAFPNDLVFTHRGTLGQVGIIPPNAKYKRYVVSQSQMKLRCDPRKADPLFVFYYFKSPQGQHALLANTSTTGVPAISSPLSTLRSIRISLPPLPEQRAIAGVLGALDDKIELNRRMNRTLESMARAVFREMMKDKGGRMKVGKIRDVCLKIENGGTPRRDKPEYWEPGIIPWLTSGEVRQEIIIATENKISEEGYKNSSAKIWNKGTTVVALYGATAGKVSLIANELCANQACCGLVPNDGWEYFVYLSLSASENSLASQARGSAQQNLSQKIVAEFPIRKPDQKQLDDFNSVVAPLFEKWIANLKQSRTLARLRDALLPKLMRGEVRVTVHE